MNNGYYNRRVVITGLGTVNALGNDVDTTWKSLLEGKRVVKQIEYFDTTNFLTKIGAQLTDFDISQYDHLVSKKNARRMDRNSHYAIAATAQALNDANLSIESNQQAESYGNIIGTGIGGLGVIYEANKKI